MLLYKLREKHMVLIITSLSISSYIIVNNLAVNNFFLHLQSNIRILNPESSVFCVIRSSYCQYTDRTCKRYDTTAINDKVNEGSHFVSEDLWQ